MTEVSLVDFQGFPCYQHVVLCVISPKSCIPLQVGVKDSTTRSRSQSNAATRAILRDHELLSSLGRYGD